jgi:flagellar basal-body rod protein FlgB
MSDTIQVLHKLMDSCAERQRVIAGNLANVNTPGYIRRDVRFQQALTEAIKSNDPEQLAQAEPKVVEDRSGSFRENGNNVSTEKEMGIMAENGLLYGLAAQVISRKYAGIHKAIQSK